MCQGRLQSKSPHGRDHVYEGLLDSIHWLRSAWNLVRTLSRIAFLVWLSGEDQLHAYNIHGRHNALHRASASSNLTSIPCSKYLSRRDISRSTHRSSCSGKFDAIDPAITEHCILPVRGFEFDTIEEVVRPPWSTRTQFSSTINESQTYPDILNKCIGLARASLHDNYLTAEAVFRTLTHWNKERPRDYPVEIHASTMHAVIRFFTFTKLIPGQDRYLDSGSMTREEQAIVFQAFQRILVAS